MIDHERALREHASLGPRVVILDVVGHIEGIGLAELLASRGLEVTLVSPLRAADAARRRDAGARAPARRAAPACAGVPTTGIAGDRRARGDARRPALGEDRARRRRVDQVVIRTHGLPEDALYLALRGTRRRWSASATPSRCATSIARSSTGTWRGGRSRRPANERGIRVPFRAPFKMVLRGREAGAGEPGAGLGCRRAPAIASRGRGGRGSVARRLRSRSRCGVRRADPTFESRREGGGGGWATANGSPSSFRHRVAELASMASRNAQSCGPAPLYFAVAHPVAAPVAGLRTLGSELHDVGLAHARRCGSGPVACGVSDENTTIEPARAGTATAASVASSKHTKPRSLSSVCERAAAVQARHDPRAAVLLVSRR